MKQIVFTIIISTCIIACKIEQQKPIVTASQAIQLDTFPGECPYLTKNTTGQTVVSWVRIIDDSTTSFCYATSHDGKKFSTPVVIPNSNNIQPHGENLPKIIFKPSGEIIALWGAANPNPKNKYSGLVFYTQSFDDGKNWTTPKPLVTDTAGYDQRYYDVALLANGEVGIIWLDNRKTTNKEGSALYFASTEGKNGFEGERLISQPCCQCCRTVLLSDKKGSIHALFRGIVQDSIRDMAHIVSIDGGKSFSSPKRISEDNWVINGCPHTGPAMTENNGGIHFAWFTGGKNKGCFYTKSTDNGKSYAMHDLISPLGAHPQIASMNNGELLIAWEEVNTSGNKPCKQIGIEKRNAEGKSLGKQFITATDAQAAFPVIAASGDGTLIVAYANKKGEKNFVTYQSLAVK